MSRRQSRCCIDLFDMDRMYIYQIHGEQITNLEWEQEVFRDHGIEEHEMG